MGKNVGSIHQTEHRRSDRAIKAFRKAAHHFLSRLSFNVSFFKIILVHTIYALLYAFAHIANFSWIANQ